MTDPDARGSSAFGLLHPRVQRWVWQQRWTELRDAQERAAGPILGGSTDVIVSAGTASGKTEAAFLPICSALVSSPSREPGVEVLYVSPLKSLINDQYGRLDALCEHLSIPVHRWHGDVPRSGKAALLREPAGVLLITPESLEALFVLQGPKIRTLFGALRYVVIDELHAFLGAERGAQLQSLLHRVELSVRRRAPRIALSATLGDMGAAAEFLRPGGGDAVLVVTAADDTQELRLQVRGYEARPPEMTPAEADVAEARGEDVGELVVSGDRLDIADDLFKTLRGSDNLVFANSRSAVETYADLLARRCERDRVPNEFHPHHGNLSRDLREYVESRLKDRSVPATAVCTSTLEMGIDIGSVASIAQIGPPHSVSGMRQRLGRSGRRGDAAVLRMYVSETAVSPETPAQDALRTALVQTIAMTNLLLARWNEPPDAGGLHLSTLVQQVLSLIAQHGGVTAADAFAALCGHGPFGSVDRATFASLLRALGAADILTQASDGLLLPGGTGERLLNHYSFYAAFQTAEEYRLVARGRTLGSIPVDHPLMPGSLLIFGGRRWKVVGVDDLAKVIELLPSSGGRPPAFAGSGGLVADRVRMEMREVYLSADVPAYLDGNARRLLAEGRSNFVRYSLDACALLGVGDDTLMFPWRGDRVMGTLHVALTGAGLETAVDGVCLTLTGVSPDAAVEHLRALHRAGPPDPVALAQHVATKVQEKYDRYLSTELLDIAYAARSLDVPGAWLVLSELVESSGGEEAPRSVSARSVSAPRRAAARIPELGVTPFAVVDVETTGFSPRLHDRVVELAVVRAHPDGVVERAWCTLLNPDRDLGPTHVHGISAGDVLDAPRFADVAGDVAELLDGAILVAHNARFDLGFLAAEFARIGAPVFRWPALCTLALSYRVGLLGGGRLADCVAAESLPLDAAHTALGDAVATAQLLQAYLRRAPQAGVSCLADLGCVPLEWHPFDASLWPRSGRTHPRGARVSVPKPPLAALISHLPAHDVAGTATPADTAAYLDVLSRALEDRRLTAPEIDALRQTALEWGLTASAAHDTHRGYLRALAATALADGVLTEFERDDLDTVRAVLGLDDADVEDALVAADRPATEGDTLRGLGVCFTGQLRARLNGALITRDQAEALARAAGLVIHERVTKRLDLLVVADPDSMSRKAATARSYGTRVLAEAAFWSAIGVACDD